MKIGIGYDIHRLTEGRPMVLGGINIPYSKGPDAHSDGDVLLHAVCDAILGALGEGDIGMRFPDTEEKFKGISSSELLRDVAGLMAERGFSVVNLDCVVFAEEPKLGLYREKIRRAISGMLSISFDAVNVKGKTMEKTGDIGSIKAIAAQVAVLLEKGDL